MLRQFRPAATRRSFCSGRSFASPRRGWLRRFVPPASHIVKIRQTAIRVLPGRGCARLLPELAREGLDAHGLSRLASRMRRAEATIEFAVAVAREALAPGPWRERGPIVFKTAQFADLPAEVALRLLGRAITQTGNEGTVELGKLELLYDALRNARAPLRRTLAGALIALAADRLTIERAPARRSSTIRRTGSRRFAK